MPALDRHTFPNKGWMFRQPQTNWTNPMAMVGFSASVNAIIKHRQQNPAITAKHKLSTDVDAVGDELEAYTRLRLGIPADPVEPTSFFQRGRSRQFARSVVAAADNISSITSGIKRAAQGTAVVLDWLTSGGNPVEQELAERRASVCVRCPKNVEGSWYTVAPAELIRETLEARKDLKLETPHDDKLKSCDVCRCLMKLKCFTPLEHILAKTPPEIMREFPAHCWIATKDK